jgi:hypothetical protein
MYPLNSYTHSSTYTCDPSAPVFATGGNALQESWWLLFNFIALPAEGEAPALPSSLLYNDLDRGATRGRVEGL